jgi:hypothetical protein
MIKKMIGWLLERFIHLFGHEISEKDVQNYIEKHYLQIKKAQPQTKNVQKDLVVLEMRLADLGWLEGTYAFDSSRIMPTADHPERMQNFTEGLCFSKEGLAPGSGQYLEWMDANPQAENRQMLAETRETLLRHVEVKREKSFHKFTWDIPLEQQWLERYDVSILFSRTARRRHDLRFLNAAFKMNEWYMRQANHTASDARMARLLVALAEQELSARELLIC